MTLLDRCRAWLRARMIDDWARAHNFMSMRLAAIGVVLEAFVQWFPATATEAWNALPQDLRALLPAWLTSSLPVILLAAIVIARVTKKVPPGG